MKVSIDIELTPEEARRMVGLPDLTPLHDRYLAMMADMMGGAPLKPEALEAMMKSWAPMGDAGLALWRRLLEGAAPKPKGG